jgi:hypothetical protein
MIGALKQLEAGRKAEDVAGEVGVSKHTIYAWKAKYGGTDVSQAQEAKQLRDSYTLRSGLVVVCVSTFSPARHRAQRLRCAAAMRARAKAERVLRLRVRGEKGLESIASAFSAASMRARSRRRWRIIPCSSVVCRIVASVLF